MEGEREVEQKGGHDRRGGGQERGEGHNRGEGGTIEGRGRGQDGEERGRGARQRKEKVDNGVQLASFMTQGEKNLSLHVSGRKTSPIPRLLPQSREGLDS